MVRKNGEGTSELFGRPGDLDLPGREGYRLAIFRETRQAESNASAIVHRAAEETGAWRTRGGRRRPRICAPSAQGRWRADRNRLSERGNAVRPQLRSHRQKRAAPERR